MPGQAATARCFPLPQAQLRSVHGSAGKVSVARHTRPGRQRDILDAFTERVAVNGYDMTSISEVAGDLHLSKGTIMYHFGSKDRMLAELSREYTERRLAELEVILEVTSDPVERLGSIIASMITAHRDDRVAALAFAREFMRFANEPIMTDVRRLRARYLVLVRTVIADGIGQGVFRPLDPRILALQIIGSCHWAWTWLRLDGPLSVEDVTTVFVTSAIAGIALGQGEVDVADTLGRRGWLPEEVIRLRSIHAAEYA